MSSYRSVFIYSDSLFFAFYVLLFVRFVYSLLLLLLCLSIILPLLFFCHYTLIHYIHSLSYIRVIRSFTPCCKENSKSKNQKSTDCIRINA